MANDNKEFDFRTLLESTEEVTEGDDWGQIKPGEEDEVNRVLSGFEPKLRGLVLQTAEQMKQTVGRGWQFRGPGALDRLLTNALRVVRDTVSSIETTTPEEKSEADQVRAEVQRRREQGEEV